MKQIIVATDGSPSAQGAIDVALELAIEQRAELTFGHVLPPDDYIVGAAVAPRSLGDVRRSDARLAELER